MLEFIKKRRFFLLALFLSLVFVWGGAMFVKSADETTLSSLSRLLSAQLKSGSASVGEQIFSAVVLDMVAVFLIYLLGFSPISAPMVVGVLGFSSFGAGMNVGYAYLSFSPSATLYIAVVLAPGIALSLLSLCLSAEESLSFSHKIFARTFKNDAQIINIKKIYKYSLNFLYFSCIIILSGVLDAFLNKIFSNVITL